MSKLLKLKEWLTLDEAARHLSSMFDEEVSEADLLRFALDGLLRLCLFFPTRAPARLGQLVPLKKSESFAPLEGGGGLGWDRRMLPQDYHHELKAFLRKGVSYSKYPFPQLGKELKLSETIRHLIGPWELSMVGRERRIIEERYRKLTDGPPVPAKYPHWAGIIILDADEAMLELQEMNYAFPRLRGFLAKRLPKDEQDKHRNRHTNPDNFLMAESFPADSALVIRPSALIDLQARLAGPDNKPQLPAPKTAGYQTHLLTVLQEAIEKFWLDHDPVRPPKKHEVADWLHREKGVSVHIANAIDTIIRPEEFKKGGNRRVS